MDRLVITSLSTTYVNILNLQEYENIHINVTVNRNTTKKAQDESKSCFCGDYKVVMIRSDEPDDKRTFLIEYAIHAEFECSNPEATPESIAHLTTIEIYPHLRAGISAVMGAAGIQPIILPPMVQ